ncbi:MAG TPA: TonB-dependent receptor [Proteobacteria bacterium]|nr:TonB-dependent receptor [Pseudomonadota bacterium]
MLTPAHRLLFIILLIATALPLPGHPVASLAAEEPSFSPQATRIDELTVKALPISPTRQEGDLLYTGSEITPDGLELAGIGGLSSVYQAFSVLPGLNPELIDPSGIGGAELRLRGIRSMFAGMSAEGIPNYGIMGIGPRDYLYDLENIESLKLYRGAAPAPLSSGTGNRGGTIALSYTRPAETSGLVLEQSLGAHSLSRSFLRLDSGRLPTAGRAFVSASHTEANKWKGRGEVGGREHLTIGLQQPLGDRFEAELFYNYDDAEMDLYQALSYNQARHISSHYNDDYLKEVTGGPADVDYYKYHHNQTENHDLVAIFTYKISQDHSLTLKPYYASEDKKWLDGAADKYVDSERFGYKLEYVGQWQDYLVSAGYWYENHDLEKYIRKNKLDGAGRNYAGWAYLAENRGAGQIHTPYFQLSRQCGPFSCQAGIKYFSLKEPASLAYLSNKDTPAVYHDALNHNLGVDAAMSLQSLRYQKWLPTLSFGFQASPTLDFYLNYGRNFMRPYAYVPLAMTYSQNRDKFQAAGITLQDVFDQWKLETSDNFDFGCRFQHRWFSLAPSIFYAQHHDLLFVAFDPKVGVNYHQNLGDATIWGVELECNIYPADNLMFYFNPSYSQATFDDDVNNSGAGLAAKNQDLPDTPRWLLKAGAIYRWGDLSFAPSLKYVDRRYGDIENREKIDRYTTVDMTIGYRLKNLKFLREAGLELECINLFDKKYVGTINADDDGSSASQYYAGVPFTLIGKISGKF